MRPSRYIPRKGWDLSLNAAVLMLWVFTATLLMANYFSRVEIQETALELIRQDTEKRAIALSYFFSERKNDLKDLSKSRGLISLAAGKAPEHRNGEDQVTDGEVVLAEFERLAREKLLDKDQIYTRVVFIGSSGELLVDTRSADSTPNMGRNWKDLLTPEAAETQIVLDPEEKTLGAMLSRPIFSGSLYAGQIIAWVSPFTFYKHFVRVSRGPTARSVAIISVDGKVTLPVGLKPGYSFPEFSKLHTLDYGGVYYYSDAKGSRSRVEDIVVTTSQVKDTPLILASMSPSREVFGWTEPHQLLLGMGMLALIVLGGMGILWRARTRNLILQTRLEDAAKREREIAEKNQQLETEIVERNRAEAALRDSEEKYRAVVDNADEAIFIVQNGFIRFPNHRTLELLGYEADELERIPFFELIHLSKREEVFHNKLQRLEGEQPVSDCAFPAVSKTGEQLWLQLSSIPWFWEGLPASLNFARDITSQHKLEAQLLHAQKMEAIGTLAGGIAHDFNNLLQAIQGYTELILQKKAETDPEYRQLKEIFRSTRRGSELTRQLLTFSRRIDSKPRLMDLNQQLEQFTKLLERTIPKMIDIELKLFDDLMPVSADPAQLEQILINLAVNARDAMPEGGTITIETENVVLDNQFCLAHMGSKPGSYVCLSVSDTGQGMESTALAHVFEPFFTTKSIGKGTGLGLAMVYGIVKSHNGYITCESEPGVGSAFRIYLPVVSRAEAPIEVAGARGDFGTVSGTILLVDDELHLRDLGQKILSDFGCSVYTAEDGAGAVNVYRRRWESIDLVILDMEMPNMNGIECLGEIKKINPDVKVALAADSSPDISVGEPEEIGAAYFIDKPYEITQLLNAVRGAIA